MRSVIPRRGALGLVAALIAVAALGTPAASAQSPAPYNDDRESAERLSDERAATGTTEGAHKAPGEPDHAGEAGGHSVWFRFYASTTSRVVIEACGSSFDTVMAVYAGGYGGDQEVASNDDTAACGPDGKGSMVRFRPPSAGTYDIALDGHGGAAGAYNVRLVSNDDRAGPFELYGDAFWATDYSNRFATAEAAEPAHAGNPASHSVWFAVPRGYPGAPQAGQEVEVNTCATAIGGLDTVLAAYADSGGGALVEIAASDDALGCGPGGTGSVLRFTLPESRVLIAADGKAGATGNFSIRLVAPPGNDDRANAYAMPTGGEYRQPGDTTRATREPGEPEHAGDPGGHSVWYALTPQPGRVSLDVCESFFDTLLAVYTDGYGGLQEVASSDDAAGCGDGGSRVQFQADGARTYYVAVDGKAGAAGPFTLRTQHTPPNDDFADAMPLEWYSYASTALATAQAGEPHHAGAPAAHSLWYRLTAEGPRAHSVSTCEQSTAPTRIAVYEGVTLGALREVAAAGPTARCAQGRGSRVRWQPSYADGETTKTYWVAVDTPGDEPAAFILSHDAAPNNDDRAQAEQIFETWDAYGNTSAATRESGEPDHAGAGGSSSVWYRFIPSRSARASVSTCASVLSDTVLAVYTEDASGLHQIGANDDAPGCGDGSQSRVEFDADADTSYLIAVDARPGGEGPFQLSARQRPPNDDRADAIRVDSVQESVYGNAGMATKEAGEPAHAGQPGGRSVWYRWTAATSGATTLDTCDYYGADTLLAVYTDGDAGLAEVVSNDDDVGCGSGGIASRVRFSTIAGTEYLIAVDVKRGVADHFALSFPPANDGFDAAMTVDPSSFSWSGVLNRATAEADEPAHAGQPARQSTWFTWTPSRTALATIDTCDYPGTRVAAYTGDRLATLTAVTARPGSQCPAGREGSRLRFEATAGTSYRIAVDGDGDASYRYYDLQGRLAPANDALAAATDLGTSASTSRSGTTVDAGLEHDEPDHAGAAGTASVWYRWRAPRSGTVRLDTCSSASFDTAVALYTQQGTGVGGLNPLAANDDSAGCGSGTASRLRVRVDAGATYWAAVSGHGDVSGEFDLRLAMGAPNDDLANAASLFTGTTNGTTVDAGDELGEPDHAGAGGDHSVWYRFVLSSARNVEIRACPTGVAPDPVLAVYESAGAAMFGAFSPVGTRTTATIGGVACQVIQLRRMTGTRYVAVDGPVGGGEGSFSLTLTIAPVNDDRDQATSVGGGTISGSTIGATREDGEPDHAGHGGGRSVWYRWTPSLTGPVTLDTCDSGIDSLLAVYVDGAGGLDPIAASDDASGCAGGGSRAAFTAHAGTEYVIAVDGKDGAQGSFVLGFPPANDHFAATRRLSGDLATVQGTTVRANAEPGEPSHAGQAAQRSVWYAWTAPRSGRAVISTCLASSAATRIALYTGEQLGTLEPVASSGPAPGCADGLGSRVNLRVAADTDYRIAVDGAAAGSFTVQVALAPVNDDRADAIEIGERGIVSATTAFATAEDGEPGRAGHGASGSVWYRLTPTQSGPVTVKTCGSSFDTVLAVYDGGDALRELAASDDAAGTCARRANMTFQGAAGTPYLIAVDGRDGATGAFQLSIGAPANDDFGRSEHLSGEHASGVARTGPATTQDDEPRGAAAIGNRSVWWTWTAPGSGPTEVNTCGSDYYTVLAAYHGTVLSTLTRDGYDQFSGGCGSRSRLTLQAEAGVTYHFQVSSYSGSGGTARLQVGPPTNDRFAGAKVLSGTDDGDTGTVEGASTEDSEPQHHPDGHGRTLWYAWTAPDTGVLVLDTCGSVTPLHIAAYQGPAISQLARLAENAGTQGCPQDAPGRRIAVPVDGGVEYRIALDTADASIGATRLHLRLTLDATPPETTIDGGPAPETNEDGHSFRFSSNEPGSTFECRIDDEAFAPCASVFARGGLAEGRHAFEVQAIDLAGNVDPAPARLEFIVDRTAPELSFQGGPAEHTNQRDANLTFSTTDGNARLECALDGEEHSACASPQSRVGLADGGHQFHVRATDRATNSATVTRTFTVDTVAPDTSLASVPADPTNDPTPLIGFSAEPGASFACSIDGAAYGACESPLSLPGLDDGDHVVRILATDQAGNVEADPAERRFEVDRTAPDTTITQRPAAPFHEGGSFAFEATEDGGFECSIDGEAFTPCDRDYSLDMLGRRPGEHEFRVRSRDAAGNVDPTPATAPFTFADESPQASLTVTPDAGAANLEVRAEIGATDSDRDALDYELDFGDGTRRNGTLPASDPLSHTYDRAGLYVVRLEVSDGYVSDVVTREVTVVLPEPLRASAGDDLLAVAGEPVRLDAGGSRPLAGIERYRWAFGDGSLGAEKVADHVYDAPGTYEATLTTEAGSQSDTDTATIRVLAPDAAEGVRVTTTSGGSPLSGADVLVVTGDGRRIAAVTDAGGHARLRGLADGEHRIMAYRDGYLPASATASVSSGAGTVTVDLKAGQVATADVSSHPMTYQEILDAGIDPNDPDNQHVYQFTVNLEVNDVGGGGGGGAGSFGGYVGGGGFIGGGSGSGWSCRRLYCKGTAHGATVYVGYHEVAPGVPTLTTLVIPFKARWLKEFFDVSMSVHNLADPGFVLRNGSAMLELPAGLKLAPTARGEHLTVPMADIAGGGDAAAHWIVRGDVEGEYRLNATYGATLEPFGRSVSIRGEMEDPLKVWGGSALKLTVETDDTVGNGYPFHVRVGLKNVADVPVYNPGVELLKEGRMGYIEQPRQQREFSAAQISPGDTFWAGPFILVPDSAGDIDLERSYLKKVAGDVDLDGTIVTKEREPSLSETPEIRGHRRNADEVVLDWEPVPGATGYEIYRTPDRNTDFGDTPIPMTPIPATAVAATKSKVTLRADELRDGGPYFAVSSRVNGTWTMVHRMLASNGMDQQSSYPRLVLDDRTECGASPATIEAHTEDPDYSLERLVYSVPSLDLEREVALSGSTSTTIIRPDRASGELVDLDGEVRNSEGEIGADTVKAGACEMSIIGDSYASGEGNGPYDPNTAADDAELLDDVVDNKCHRSDASYGRKIAERRSDMTLGAFAPCSGAVAADVTSSNHDPEGNPGVGAQVEALTGYEDLIVMTMGGNDMDFGGILQKCLPTALFDPGLYLGDLGVCKLAWGPGVAGNARALPGRLDTAYRAIRNRNRGARVIILGYPMIFPRFAYGLCSPFHPSDVEWMHNKIVMTNQLIEAEALEHGFEFVNPNASDRLKGHDWCSFSSFFTSPTRQKEENFHPNSSGHGAMADAVSERIDGGAPGEEMEVLPGKTVTRQVEISSGQASTSFTTRWVGSDVGLSLRSPSGRTIDRASVPAGVTHFLQPTNETYTIANPEPGEWTVHLTGLDVPVGGEPVTLSSTQTPKLAPTTTALATASETSGSAPHTVHFDGRASVSDDGSALSYGWDFGDGTTASGARAEHTYAAPGKYEAVLTTSAPGATSDTYRLGPIVIDPAVGSGGGGGSSGGGGGAGGISDDDAGMPGAGGAMPESGAVGSGASGTGGTSSVRARVRLGNVRFSKGRRFAMVRVRCLRSAGCRGRVEIRVSGRKVGSARFKLKRNANGSVRVVLKRVPARGKAIVLAFLNASKAPAAKTKATLPRR